jgi:hypothetical protein
MTRYLLLLVISTCLPSALFAEDLTLTTAHPGGRQFLAQPGERAIVQGYAEHGLEAWIYPFQILRNYCVSIVGEGGALTPVASLLTSTSVRPESVERVYTGQDFKLIEHWFVPRDKAGVVMSYRLTGTRRLRIQVAFEPVLDLMWPGGIGGQESSWDANLHAFDIHETTDQFHAYIGSPEGDGHSDPTSYAEPWKGRRELAMTLPLSPGGDPATVQMTLTIRGKYNGVSEYRTLLRGWQKEEAQVRADYASRLARMVDLQTPDEAANRAFRWAEIALEQAWVCNPYLGCGLIGGYGPSRDTRRPQYDWFFGGDGLTATEGLNAAGDHGRVKEEFAFLRRYQDKKNGMMWHEISQSAGLLDWSKYPFQFRHVDISMEYVQTAAAVWKTTSDRQWLRGNWPSIEAAYRYSLSVCDPASGLPLISAGMQGQNEQLVLRDELSLSMGLLAAEEGYASLAEAQGEQQGSQKAHQAAAKLRATIRQRYWDGKAGFVYQGFTPSGAPVGQSKAPIDALSGGAFSEEQQNTLIKRLLQPDFLTGWGIRSTPSSDPAYNPSSYATGSVWAIANAAATVALWGHGYAAPAFSIWSKLAAATTIDAPGHLDEVFSGEEFRPLNVSVPAQTWSSAGFVSATVAGLLGYQGNSVTRVVELAPHLPSGWDKLGAKRLPFGSSTVDVNVEKTGQGVELDLAAGDKGYGSEQPERYSVAVELSCNAPQATANGSAATLETRSLNGRTTGSVEGAWGKSGRVHLEVTCPGSKP